MKKSDLYNKLLREVYQIPTSQGHIRVVRKIEDDHIDALRYAFGLAANETVVYVVPSFIDFIPIDFTIGADISSPEPVHSCKDHMRVYEGFTSRYKYCQVCDKKEEI